MNELLRDLEESGWIHKPLPLHEERSLEAFAQAKRVLGRRPVTANDGDWSAVGRCALAGAPEEGLAIEAPLFLEGRPNGDLEHGDCNNYGSFGLRLAVPFENWEAYNRVSLSIRPVCRGVRKICARLCFENDGAVKLPDRYFRDGFHTINLKANEWNRCSVEIPALPRDRVIGLGLMFSHSGCETLSSLGNSLRVSVGDVVLECVEAPEVALGWLPDAASIAYCFSGYAPDAVKRAVARGEGAEAFALEDEEGVAVFDGKAERASIGGLAVLDFSSFRTPGRYRLRMGECRTEFFPIEKDVWIPSAWKTINFLFTERCGYPVPGVHQSCHRDAVAVHNGKRLLFNGGWHDAGDLSQQLIQTAEVTWSLFELAAALDEDQRALRLRLREEALWGLDYVLKSRFGDGYRATSIGVSMWSQGFLGDPDDITVRLHDNAYENYLCSAAEAYCAGQLGDDSVFQQAVLECARQDFAFAEARFQKTGFSERPPIYWEHSWMTSESAFRATASLAASLLHEATGDEGYARSARESMDYVLSCQCEGPAGEAFPLGGFFYRNPGRKSIVHFSHQARDQIFAQALDAILRTQRDHPDAQKWRAALARHADYFKRLACFASPYGMMPAGLYRLDEAGDRESFERQHIETGEEAYRNYEAQLRAGRDVGGGFFLRQFPVWFSFKGNNAVLLSMGKAAAICGRALSEKALLDAAGRQLEWNVGVNPFRQSLMYGEGLRYAQQYAAMSGEAAGELPVGVQTLDNGDEPYWPQMNNATYKEVWTTPAARWLSLMAEIIEAKRRAGAV